MLPACEATAAAQRAQLVTEQGLDAKLDMETALKEAWAAGETIRLKVTTRHVRRRIAALRTGAQSGGSATCNDVICAIGSARGGAECLRDWVQSWATGKVPPSVATLFLEHVLT